MAGLDAEFEDLMLDVVTIAHHTGQDGFGRPTYGDPVTYKARCVGRMRRVQSAKGEDTVSSTTTVLLNATAVSSNDRLTLPEGFEPRTPPIIAVLRDKDDRNGITITVYS